MTLTGSFISESEEQTKEIGARLASSLRGDEVILIYGGLAAGKTVFIKGLARGLGIDENLVSSPTFTLLNIYSGKALLFHLDLYRIEGGRELETIGVEDFLGEGVIAVEWGEKAEGQPWTEQAIKVKIEVEPSGRRIIKIE